MALNAAQELVLSYYGKGEVRRDPHHAYKAPHAYRGTPARPHRERYPHMVFSKADEGLIPARRPFKGHRP